MEHMTTCVRGLLHERHTILICLAERSAPHASANSWDSNVNKEPVAYALPNSNVRSRRCRRHPGRSVRIEPYFGIPKHSDGLAASC